MQNNIVVRELDARPHALSALLLLNSFVYRVSVLAAILDKMLPLLALLTEPL